MKYKWQALIKSSITIFIISLLKLNYTSVSKKDETNWLTRAIFLTINGRMQCMAHLAGDHCSVWIVPFGVIMDHWLLYNTKNTNYWCVLLVMVSCTCIIAFFYNYFHLQSSVHVPYIIYRPKLMWNFVQQNSWLSCTEKKYSIKNIISSCLAN